MNRGYNRRRAWWLFSVLAVTAGIAAGATWFRMKPAVLATSGFAAALNDWGNVVGFVPGQGQEPGIGVMWTESGEIVRLGERVSPHAINNLNQVVGSIGGEDLVTETAFFWSRSRGIIPLTLGGRKSFAVALNQRGQVIGTSELPPDEHDNVRTHAFFWSEGRITDLGDVSAIDLNDRGDVLLGAPPAFQIWSEEHGVKTIEPPDGWSGVFGIAINNNRQVLGTRYTERDDQRGWLWTEHDGFTDMGTLGGANTSPRKLTEWGAVAGVSETSNGKAHAFLWIKGGRMADLGSLGNGDYALGEPMGLSVLDMNQATWMIGTWTVRVDTGQTIYYPRYPFLWTPFTGMLDLRRFGAEVVVAINNRGQVVGNGSNGGVTLWTPALGFPAPNQQ